MKTGVFNSNFNKQLLLLVWPHKFVTGNSLLNIFLSSEIIILYSFIGLNELQLCDRKLMTEASNNNFRISEATNNGSDKFSAYLKQNPIEISLHLMFVPFAEKRHAMLQARSKHFRSLHITQSTCIHDTYIGGQPSANALP